VQPRVSGVNGPEWGTGDSCAKLGNPNVRQLGTYEVKTHLAELLQAVEQGDTIIVTRRGKPIAKIEPYRRPPMAIDSMAQEFGRLRRSLKRGGALRGSIEEGRRF
jgi:prevent-host-death family protein